MKTLHIVIEGMPGAGKTSVINFLINKNLGYVFHKETFFSSADDIFNDFEKEKKYLDAEILKIKDFKINKVNIFDRNFISVLAYSFALEKINIVEKGFYERIKKICIQMLSNKSIVLPDITYILLVSPDISITRRLKYANDPNYAIWFRKDFLNYFFDFYKNTEWTTFTKSSVRIINAEKKKISELSNGIINTIYEYLL